MVEPAAFVQEQFDDAEQQREAASLGMWVFLGTEVLFFGVLFAAYVIGRFLFPEGFAQASRHTHIVLGTANTAVLLTSSLFMALAVRAAKLNERRALIGYLIATFCLGLVFLGIKGFEYFEEYREALVPAVNLRAGSGPDPVVLFFFLYFVMTGFHAVHLTIGIVVIAVLVLTARSGRYTGGYYHPVEIAGLYWHFVDIVWIFLYPLIYLVARS